MECVTTGRAVQFAFTARRNNSLTSSGRSLVFAFIFAVSVGIGLAFTLVFGAWLILPFCGAELLGLFLAFRHVDRHAADYESVSIEGNCLTVELFESGRVRRFEFNPSWSEVVCDRDGSRLALKSHGREVEIGRHLNEEQRLAVALRLNRKLRAMR